MSEPVTPRGADPPPTETAAPRRRDVAALARDALLVAEILVAYGPARLRLHRRRLPDLVAASRSMRRRPLPALSEPEATRVAARLGRAVTRTLALLPTDSRCLVSSFVLSRLLERRGIDARLVVAVCPEPEFAAHAWVEHRGRPLLRSGGPGYQRLVEL
jgi:hypothetical protein